MTIADIIIEINKLVEEHGEEFAKLLSNDCIVIQTKKLINSPCYQISVFNEKGMFIDSIEGISKDFLDEIKLVIKTMLINYSNKIVFPIK